MKTTKIQNKPVTESDLLAIVNASTPNYAAKGAQFQAALLRQAAHALDQIEPENFENLKLAHQLATWAGQLEASIDSELECACGRKRADCICSQLAADVYLMTGIPTRLIGLGWPTSLFKDLRDGAIKPVDLLETEWINFYQRGATPVDLRCQGM